MDKWYGVIGYGISKETKPGVWKKEIIEKGVYGEVVRSSRRMQSSGNLIDNITVERSISIIADPFAIENFLNILYVEFLGVRWKVSTVEPQFPRLILTLGEVYNGE